MAIDYALIIVTVVVRSLLVPTLVSAFGRWNWWLPDWVARVLRVAPSHPHPEPPARHTVSA